MGGCVGFQWVGGRFSHGSWAYTGPTGVAAVVTLAVSSRIVAVKVVVVVLAVYSSVLLYTTWNNFYVSGIG